MMQIPVYPLTAYHPVHGAVTVKDADEAAKTFSNPLDWFETAEEADQHRTENEAAIVIHNARRGQITAHEQGSTPGVVKHSVTHQATVDQALEQAASAAKAVGVEPPKAPDETRAAELAI